MLIAHVAAISSQDMCYPKQASNKFNKLRTPNSDSTNVLKKKMEGLIAVAERKKALSIGIMMRLKICVLIFAQMRNLENVRPFMLRP